MEKGNYEEINSVFLEIANEHLKNKEITTEKISVDSAIKNPILTNYLELEQGIAFLFANKLNGKRHSGPKEGILSDNAKELITLYKIEKTHLPPLLLRNEKNDRAVLLSAIHSDLNQELIKKHILVNALNVRVV